MTHSPHDSGAPLLSRKARRQQAERAAVAELETVPIEIGFWDDVEPSVVVSPDKSVVELVETTEPALEPVLSVVEPVETTESADLSVVEPVETTEAELETLVVDPVLSVVEPVETTDAARDTEPEPVIVVEEPVEIDPITGEITSPTWEAITEVPPEARRSTNAGYTWVHYLILIMLAALLGLLLWQLIRGDNAITEQIVGSDFSVFSLRLIT
ncbi:MAG: hypothetical protein FWG25_02415 [Promicromonosporaceae bacterium]|nr:hypothetical protein [Promicromonosporaceae bacterium]